MLFPEVAPNVRHAGSVSSRRLRCNSAVLMKAAEDSTPRRAIALRRSMFECGCLCRFSFDELPRTTRPIARVSREAPQYVRIHRANVILSQDTPSAAGVHLPH